MSRPRLKPAVREGFCAPYLDATRRHAIADFVADIPLEKDHPSASVLDGIAEQIKSLSQVPALLLWGPRDKVFSDLYLQDLEMRLPQASVHRYPLAAHFVTEDTNAHLAIVEWLEHLDTSLSTSPTPSFDNTSTYKQSATEQKVRLTGRRALSDFSIVDEKTDAVVESATVQGGSANSNERAAGSTSKRLTFGELNQQVNVLAAGMSAFGIHPGDRVAVMIMPGIDLVKVVYACWRLGAALVLVDSGLGREGMQRALRGANPDYLIGINKALVAARVLNWPGKRIAVNHLSDRRCRLLDVVCDLEQLARLGQDAAVPAWPDDNAVAAVVFTSGSTGPSKGVIYLHAQVQAQRDTLTALYNITTDDRLVAAFAPFALYGPSMGITSIVPEMDVTKPASLTAGSLATAIESVQATLVFASPASLLNVVTTRDQLSGQAKAACENVRLTLSAGAPVRDSLLASAKAVFPNAKFHTPYGMTEVLPVADISLEELQACHSPGAGVCVGFPVPDTQVLIDPLDSQGRPSGVPALNSYVLGEIIVRAAHSRHGYDRLWFTQHQASQPAGAHRTGDIGQLDDEGRLWVGGRLAHIIVSADGPIAPVAAEQQIETLPQVAMAAVVGVGPVGAQVSVAVVTLTGQGMTVQADARVSAPMASLALIDEIRGALKTLSIDIAAVLISERLPVDRRHNSKVDRSGVAAWAEAILAGEKVVSL